MQILVEQLLNIPDIYRLCVQQTYSDTEYRGDILRIKT